MRIPDQKSEPCLEVAQVKYRLHVQRKVSDSERERVRQRGLEAETQRKGRTAQVLEKAPKNGTGRLDKSLTLSEQCGELNDQALCFINTPIHVLLYVTKPARDFRL